jgi:hypothetical protein
MLPLNSDSWLDLSLLSDDSLSVAPRQADEEVFRLFDRHAAPLLRYVASFRRRMHRRPTACRWVLSRSLSLDR